MNTVIFSIKNATFVLVLLSSGAYAGHLDDVAQFLAGRPQASNSSVPAVLRESKHWQQFAKEMDQEWKEYDHAFVKPASEWSKRELSKDVQSSTLFYPFSGPDIVTALVLFPEVEQSVLVGLEPCGSVPNLSTFSEAALASYLADLRTSLGAVLNYGFFITKKMKVDLNATKVNGTVPVLLLFLARHGKVVVDLRKVDLDESGRIVGVDSSKVSSGVEISFTDTNGQTPKKLYYFSADLSNSGIKNNQAFAAYMKSLGKFTSFLKSDSYLVHLSHFSMIRDFLLNQSHALLQDDSGVPFKYFDSKWEKTLYGSYKGPISIFQKYFQPDLRSAFEERDRAKRLDFGIGYKWRKNESNLVLVKKKSGGAV